VAGRREIRPTQSGELRHLCNLEKLKLAEDGTPLLDAAGSPLIQYELWAENVFFAIDDWKPIESYNANQVGSLLWTRIRIRFRPGLEGIAPNTMRFVHCLNPGKSPGIFDYYDIQGAIRDITMRVELQLTCARRDVAGYRTGQTP
jgi:hypothetical protein